jgi:hypothetical protein
VKQGDGVWRQRDEEWRDMLPHPFARVMRSKVKIMGLPPIAPQPHAKSNVECKRRKARGVENGESKYLCINVIKAMWRCKV